MLAVVAIGHPYSTQYPSIIYGIITEQSIPTLFMAGIGPGVFLTFCFTLYSIIYAARDKNYQSLKRASWAVRIRQQSGLTHAYFGGCHYWRYLFWDCDLSESAGVGFVLALVITIAMGRMSWQKLREAAQQAMK